MTGTHVPRAGVLAKIVAYVIDAAIVGLPLFAALAALPLTLGDLSAGIDGARLALAFALFAVWILLAEAATYAFATMRGGSRGTPGMKVARIRVVDAETWRSIGTGPALVRSLMFVPTALSVVGLVLQVFDRGGRGWHDRVAGTVTIAVPGGGKAGVAPVEVDSELDGDAEEAEDASGDEDSGAESLADEPAAARRGGKARGGKDARGIISAVPGFDRPEVEAPTAPEVVITEIPDEDVLDTIVTVAPAAPHFSADPAKEEADSGAEPDEDLDATRISRTGQEEDADATRRAAPAEGAPAALLTWDDGITAVVRSVTVFGRNPVAGDLETADLVPIPDTTRSLSKTHFAVLVEDGQFFVVDRHSTNGTEIVSADGTTRGAFPGTKTPVEAGDRLVIAQRTLTIGRA